MAKQFGITRYKKLKNGMLKLIHPDGETTRVQYSDHYINNLDIKAYNQSISIIEKKDSYYIDFNKMKLSQIGLSMFFPVFIYDIFKNIKTSTITLGTIIISAAVSLELSRIIEEKLASRKYNKIQSAVFSYEAINKYLIQEEKKKRLLKRTGIKTKKILSKSGKFIMNDAIRLPLRSLKKLSQNASFLEINDKPIKEQDRLLEQEGIPYVYKPNKKD